MRVRGVTISTHGNGNDWAGDRTVEAFADVRRLGGTWVAIHPYARITPDGSVRPWQGRDNPTPVARPIREAHAQGLKILIVPHLAHWGSGFSSRGDVEFPHGERRERFFAAYADWIEGLAEVARDADAIAVGSETDRCVNEDSRWRALIAAVRARTGAALTYGANWDRYQEVPFWDALDAVGIQAYFPLVGAQVERPTREHLERGWAERMREVAAYSRRLGKHVVFTELGYNRAWRTAHAPWEYATDGPDAEELQALCLEVALRAVEHEPRVVGAFLWKWFPPPRRNGRNFQLATEANMRAIAGAWQPAAGR